MKKRTISSDDVQQWHTQEILAGIAEADAGQVIDHCRIKAMVARWRRPIDCEDSKDHFAP
jgi:predicted transcriptional regulator